MRSSLTALCGLFIENRDRIKGAFAWENSYIYPVCAAIFTDKRQTADTERMKACRTLLKDSTGLFSNFRGAAKLAMVALLAVDERPEEKLQNALRVYDCLKEHFFSSAFLPIAALVIAGATEASRYSTLAIRTRHIYNLMKAEHPFLTSGSDSVFAALLALSEKSVEALVAQTEHCYRLLKPRFFSGNAVQSLSHALALGEGTPEAKCARTLSLFDGLRAKGRKYGTNYELATLGVLALLPADKGVLEDDVLAVDAFLATQRGYGFFGPGKRQRLMHAGMIVMSDYMATSNDPSMTSAALGGTISLIIAQQVALCAAVASSAAIAASSSSGS